MVLIMLINPKVALSVCLSLTFMFYVMDVDGRRTRNVCSFDDEWQLATGIRPSRYLSVAFVLAVGIGINHAPNDQVCGQALVRSR